MFRKNIICLSLALASASSFAANPHIVVAPTCLTQQLSTPHETLSTTKTLSLISGNDQLIDDLVTLKQHQKTPCGGFMDVTSSWHQFNSATTHQKKSAKQFLKNYQSQTSSLNTQTYQIKYQTEVNQLLNTIRPDLAWNRLIALTQYRDRYANSDNGLKVANDIKNEMEQLAKQFNRQDVSVYFVPTGFFYKQPSVVAKIGNSTDAGVVIGSHMDTLSGILSAKPGADDDGSGTVTTLETARTVISSGMHFKKPLYFIWYAAEELGLVGSQYVVDDFIKNNIPVANVLQFDMTGYAYKNDLTMWVISDYVNPDLTNYLEVLIKTYVKQPVKRMSCGYACSDHASWTEKGFTAAAPAESAYETVNPYIHTSADTIEKLSLAHITNHIKLGVAFAVELAEPIS